MTTVQITSGPPLTGQFEAVIVDVDKVPPPDVVRTDEPLQVDCKWYIEGGLASSIGGTWHLQVAFESIGPGPELRLPTTEMDIDLDGRVGSANPYVASVDIPAGDKFPGTSLEKVPATVPDRELSEPYEITALLTYTDVNGKAGPLAATADLHVLTYFR